jgi:hypothetical protein
MAAEAARAGSRPAVGMSPGRLFACVVVATLLLDAVTALQARGPLIDLEAGYAGRLSIGLGAGFVGMRLIRRIVPAVGASWGGMMAATFLTDAVYILSGRAVVDHNGPGIVYVQVITTAVIGLAAPLIGALACLLLQRLAARRG